MIAILGALTAGLLTYGFVRARRWQARRAQEYA